MAVLHATRAYEDVYLEDPAENPDTPRFRVWLDDESIESMLAKVGDAIGRAQALARADASAGTEEERAEAVRATARLQKRVISAIVGADGYRAILEWMGGGEAVDPERHIRQLGEVFAALLTMLGRKATSEQLRACGLYFSREGARAAELDSLMRQAGPRQRLAAVDGGRGGKRKRRK